MLTRHELIDTERTVRDMQVLSIYLDGSAHDPARRTVWRTQLEHALQHARDRIENPAQARAFDQAAARLHQALAPLTGAVGAPGWVAFVTPDAIRLQTPLPVPTPLRVHWGQGALIAPALRALKEARAAIVAIVDSRSAHIFRYAQRRLEPLGVLHAYTPLEPVSHMGTPPHTGFHTGTRGRTGTDAAEREHRAGREQLVRELASRIVELAGSDSWVLLGGAPEAAHEAMAVLPNDVAARALLMPELQLHATHSDIARHAAKGASTLRRREELAAVRTLVERAAGGGRAAIGITPVKHALESGGVQRLYMSSHFTEEHPLRATVLARSTFDEGGDVEVVSGEGAALLDMVDAEGVGALLRFTVSSRPRSMLHEETAPRDTPAS
ncbi:MAG TPA: hypothetical protein VF166_05575 [Gemmatimonadaceae bacterium]